MLGNLVLSNSIRTLLDVISMLGLITIVIFIIFVLESFIYTKFVELKARVAQRKAMKEFEKNLDDKIDYFVSKLLDEYEDENND